MLGYATTAQLAALLKHPVLAGLAQLTVYRATADTDTDEAVRLLAKCRHLRNLRGLSLAFAGSDGACEALAAAPWEGLEWFRPNCHGIGPAGLAALAGAGWFRQLRELVLAEALPDETFAALGRLPAFARLHTLDLSSNDFPVAAWRAFARTRTFPALTRLRLGGGNMSDGRAGALAAADGFALRALDLREGGVGPGDGAALAAAPWAGTLTALDLALNDLGPTGTKAVAAGPFGALRHLNLARSSIGPTGLAALAANPALRGLRALNLSHVEAARRQPPHAGALRAVPRETGHARPAAPRPVRAAARRAGGPAPHRPAVRVAHPAGAERVPAHRRDRRGAGGGAGAGQPDPARPEQQPADDRPGAIGRPGGAPAARVVYTRRGPPAGAPRPPAPPPPRRAGVRRASVTSRKRQRRTSESIADAEQLGPPLQPEGLGQHSPGHRPGSVCSLDAA